MGGKGTAFNDSLVVKASGGQTLTMVYIEYGIRLPEIRPRVMLHDPVLVWMFLAAAEGRQNAERGNEVQGPALLLNDASATVGDSGCSEWMQVLLWVGDSGCSLFRVDLITL